MMFSRLPLSASGKQAIIDYPTYVTCLSWSTHQVASRNEADSPEIIKGTCHYVYQIARMMPEAWLSSVLIEISHSFSFKAAPYRRIRHMAVY